MINSNQANQQNSKQEWCLDLFFLFPSQGAGRIMGALWNSHADKVDIENIEENIGKDDDHYRLW